jgi:protein MpaA
LTGRQPAPLKSRAAGGTAVALASSVLIALVGCSAKAGTPPPSAVPETTITARPHSSTFERHPQIGFRASAVNAEFRCSLDGKSFHSCASPVQLPRLDYGRHDFRVQSVLDTEADPTPAAVRFEVVPRREVIGHSVDGRPIVVRRWGDPWRERSMLVVGNIHGNEQQGIRVVDRISGHIGRSLHGVDLWTIETVNPDGLAANTRGNAHGVDLNRNFPYGWRSIPPSSGYYSGPQALSEPESRAVKRFLQRVRPEISVWYHQPWGATLIPCNRSDDTALLYARLSGLGPRDDCNQSAYPGSVIRWQDHVLGTIAFVVEFPAGSLSRAEVRRHTSAVLRIAKG